MATGTAIPPSAANSGRARRRRSRSSPMSNSRRTSSPTTKKKNVIRPLLTQPRRSWEMPESPRRIESGVRQTLTYEERSTLAQAIAASAAARSTTALPVSVARKSRSGCCRLRAQAVRPEKADRADESLIPPAFHPRRLAASRLSRRMSSQPDLPSSRVLSQSQLETLAEHGEERSAEAGEKLYEIGDPSYPFIAIVEGEVAILDRAGSEVVRHGRAGFLGEMNLLSGQTVFL